MHLNREAGEKLVKKNYSMLSIIWLFIILSLSHKVLADDYMDALRDEATKLEYLDETRPGNAISTKPKNVSPDILKAMKNIGNFESYYRKKDSASAAVYFRLNPQERLRIYHRFKSTRDFDVARKMTIEIFNQKQQ